jgi:hypothetical protein
VRKITVTNELNLLVAVLCTVAFVGCCIKTRWWMALAQFVFAAANYYVAFLPEEE